MKKRKTNFITYAIREIILVVIGILIAVSINNLNETRKQHREFKNILLNVKEDIRNDIGKIDVVFEKYKSKKILFDNVLDLKYSAQDYQKKPEIGMLLLGFPEISFNKRSVSMLEKFQGSVELSREELAQEIIAFYNEQLWEIKVDDELRAEDFKENFRYWKNNTDWWADYLSFKLNDDFIEYALNTKDYRNRIATARFYAYQVFLPEIKKFKDKGLEIIKKIEEVEE